MNPNHPSKLNIPANVRIESQAPDPAQLNALVEEVKTTPFIGIFTLEELHALQAAGSIRYFYDEDGLAGFAAWVNIGNEWVEIGPIYAAISHRAKGIGNVLADFVVEYNIEQGRKVYGVTKNDIVKKMFRRHGFSQMSFWQLPFILKRYTLRRIANLERLVQLWRKRTHDTMAHFIRLS
jgi:hypothetical protein